MPRLSAAVLILAALAAPCAAETEFKVPKLSDTQSRALQDARAQDARGDEAAAFAAWRALLQTDIDAIDVALRVAAMARARLGASAAHALLAGMGGPQSQAIRLATATLAELSERRNVLDAFVAAHPDYGPGYALLAAEYSRERFEDQPLRDRLRERELLSRFLGLDAQGRLAASFFDSTALAGWLDRAERRLAALDRALSGAVAAPSASFMRSNSDWMVNLNMPEEPSEVGYRLGEGTTFTSTGYMDAVDARTGRRMVATHFSLSLETPATTIYVKYRDIDGREAGPFAIAFDPHAIILQKSRETLEADNSGWAIFTSGFTKDWVYFNTLMETRCVIAKVEYGFDGPPAQVFALPPCEMRDPSATPADAQSAVKMGPEVKSVSVRLTLTDGTIGTRVYRRPPPR